jgi:hypothetical protein
LLSLFFLSLKDLSKIPQKQVDRLYYMCNAFSFKLKAQVPDFKLIKPWRRRDNRVWLPHAVTTTQA